VNYKKSILIISQGYWPEHFPINHFIDNLYDDKKIEISVLTGFPNYPEGKIYKGYEKNFFRKFYDKHPSGYNIYRVPVFRRIKNNKISVILNYLSFIFMGIFLSPVLLKKKKFDHIIVFANSPVPQAFIGIFLKYIKKSKLIVWVQDLWPEILKETGYVKNIFFLSLINFFIKKIYNFSDLILAQSKSFRREIKKKTKKKVIYFPNPSIDMSKKLKKKKLKKNIFKILYAGNIGEAQNLEKIVKISKLLTHHKIIFQIIGGGNKYDWLKERIVNERIKNIEIYNNIDFKKIHKYYDKADCLLISLRNKKCLNMTIPSKLQNYLSAKKPILSICGGETQKIIINNQCGLDLYKISNKSISKNIISISKKKQNILDKMSLRGYKFFIKNFEINKIRKDFYKILDNEKI
jgi:hypothetical protein